MSPQFLVTTLLLSVKGWGWNSETPKNRRTRRGHRNTEEHKWTKSWKRSWPAPWPPGHLTGDPESWFGTFRGVPVRPCRNCGWRRAGGTWTPSTSPPRRRPDASRAAPCAGSSRGCSGRKEKKNVTYKKLPFETFILDRLSTFNLMENF